MFHAHHKQQPQHPQGHQQGPQQGGAKEQTVVIRSAHDQKHILFVSDDNVRGYNGDFDVRTHTSDNEARNKVVLVHIENDVFKIRCSTNHSHHLFVSNDHHRKFNADFDVRTHANSNEERDKFIIQHVRGDIYVIRSFTNQDFYVFPANDGSNALGQDWDIRAHNHVEARNEWIIQGFQHPLVNQHVIMRPSQSPNHQLFVANDGSNNYHSDFDVRTHDSNEPRNTVVFHHVEKNIYLIHSHTNPDQYIFASNDQHRNYNGDFDVRTHANSTEERNKWIVEAHGQNKFTIRSFTNQDHFLFAAEDKSRAFGPDFDVRTHAHKEERNHWFLEGFHQ